ncbi:zf-HC2 domain-containing protein [Paenibacillus aurantius]|uniref:Anti-sigma-W factor RsiW n=1 Tax=Paenibacillus aurantius TaxID=2918900 RepID=A0AA96LEJ1_9BACL|nr:zf-HC2 domain-containing protein [Paenibacillus aurantius]WNQ11783.1 zf-HC2 domain-containing protein [Paenibacillus aurantius]
MDCKQAVREMHEFLDGTLTGPKAAALKEHMLSCPDCRLVFQQLETTDALVKSMPRPSAPDDLTDRIMGALPQSRKKASWLQWVKRHPAISVASVFLLVMVSSFLSLWNEDTQMTVKGANLDQLVIKGDTVYLPAGHKVNGDLMVKRGKIQVDGELNGNLIVIDGTYALASTAKISGETRVIDQALQWLWFEMNEMVGGLAK